jgi:hypothetical protein
MLSIPFERCFSVAQLVIDLIQFLDLPIKLSDYQVCVLVHLQDIFLNSFESLLALLLRLVTHLDDCLSTVYVNVLAALVSILEEVILCAQVVSTGIQPLLQTGNGLLELFVLRFVGFDLTLKGARLDGVLVSVHQSSNAFEVLLVLAHRLLLGSALQGLHSS